MERDVYTVGEQLAPWKFSPDDRDKWHRRCRANVTFWVTGCKYFRDQVLAVSNSKMALMVGLLALIITSFWFYNRIPVTGTR